MSIKEPKLKIIYIASSWRSGSTLLDLIVGSAPNTIGVGELMSLDKFAADPEHRRDDAGYTPLRSPIWGPIVKDLDTFQTVKDLNRKRLSALERLRIILGKNPKSFPEWYDYEKLYRAIQVQSEKVYDEPIHVIVDSSKPLSRLVEIHQAKKSEVYVIHLIRDIRGVVNSNRNKGYSVSKTVCNWLYTNIGLARYISSQIADTHRMTISYEKFVAEPNYYIDLINQKIGISIPEAYIPVINNKPSYRFSGNIMRHGSFSGVVPDTRWHRQLPWYYQLLLLPIWLVTKVFL